MLSGVRLNERRLPGSGTATRNGRHWAQSCRRTIAKLREAVRLRPLDIAHMFLLCST